jgi:hypothetical protein
MDKKLFLLITCILIYSNSFAQDLFKGYENLFTEPKQYITHYTSIKPDIDGSINDKVWEKAAWSDFFEDIEGSKRPTPTYKTRMKMLWNDSSLYIAAELQEPDVWATLQNRDDTVYFDNDFEVFIDPDGDSEEYYEIEVNAINTVFDLFLKKTYRVGGRANVYWNLENFESAVQVQGTINNPNDTDKGWTVEMSIPFHYLKNENNKSDIPIEGSLWRINFSRVNWDAEIINNTYKRKSDNKGKLLPEHNWVWSQIGVIDMHWPERWGYLKFVKGTSNKTVFPLPYSEMQKRYLWLVYYKQKQYFRTNKEYATSLKLIDLPAEFNIDGSLNKLLLVSDGKSFSATIQSKVGGELAINEHGLIHTTKAK